MSSRSGFKPPPPGPAQQSAVSKSRVDRKAAKAAAKAERVGKARERERREQVQVRNETQTAGKQTGRKGKVTPAEGDSLRAAGDSVRGSGDSRGPGKKISPQEEIAQWRAECGFVKGNISACGTQGEMSVARALVARVNPELVSGSVTDRLLEALVDPRRGNFTRIVRPSVYQGFEKEWRASVGAALTDLEVEFKTGDLLRVFAEMDRMCQELFLREVQNKAVRILAHKKRKSKGRK